MRVSVRVRGRVRLESGLGLVEVERDHLEAEAPRKGRVVVGRVSTEAVRVNAYDLVRDRARGA